MSPYPGRMKAGPTPTCWELQDSTDWDHTDQGAGLGGTFSWLCPFTQVMLISLEGFVGSRQSYRGHGAAWDGWVSAPDTETRERREEALVLSLAPGSPVWTWPSVFPSWGDKTFQLFLSLDLPLSYFYWGGEAAPARQVKEAPSTRVSISPFLKRGWRLGNGIRHS